MNTALIITSIVGVAIAVLVIIQLQKRKAKQDAQNRPIENFTSVTIDFSDKGATPTSVNNWTKRSPGNIQFLSYCELPMLYQLCADQGKDETLADMPAGWKAPDIWVIVVPPDHKSVDPIDPGAPLLNVRQNIGTQDHPNISLISTAGTTIGRAAPGTSPLTFDIIGGYAMQLAAVVAVDKDDLNHPRFFRNAVRYELEHVVECANDAQVAAGYLFASDQHPHRGRDIWADPLPEVPAA